MLSVLLINQANSNETWELPADSFTINEELNAIRTGQVSVNFKVLQEMAQSIGTSVTYIISGGPREIMIVDTLYSPDSIIFRGIIRNYQYSSTSSEPSTISINFADFGLMLARRVGQAYAFYDNIEAGEIFSAELTAANSRGDTGLQMGTLPTTTKRQRTVEYTNLLDLLTGMSNTKTKNGFDFAIDNNGVINIYNPTRGEQQVNLVLETRNSLQPQTGGKLKGELCNRVLVQGGEQTDESGAVTQEAIMVIEEDTTSQAIWGIHEQYLSATDISTEAFLRQRGQQLLAELAYPANTENLSLKHLGDDPDWRSYNVGDWLKVELASFGINQMWRVKKRTINWSGGVYQCSLTLSKEIS